MRYLPLKVLLGVVVCLLGLAVIQKAWATDVNKPAVQRVAVAPAAPTWTGCGVAGHGALVSGMVDFGSPVKVGADGMAFGVDVLCDWQFQKMVVGLMASHSWLHGDLNTLSIERELAVSGRVGYVMWPHLLGYVRVGWSRLDTGGGDVDGYLLAIGGEIKVPDAPIFLSLEAGKSFYSDVLNSGLDADALKVTTRATWKFNWTR